MTWIYDMATKGFVPLAQNSFQASDDGIFVFRNGDHLCIRERGFDRRWYPGEAFVRDGVSYRLPRAYMADVMYDGYFAPWRIETASDLPP